MVVLKEILVATDFSDPSNAALNYGRALARSFGATLHVLHVMDNVVSRYATEFAIAEDPEAQRQVEDAVRTKLNALVSEADRETIRARPILRTADAPAAAIADYAKQAKVDLIVVGTHGRGAMAHFLLGSVAERVIRIAPCPVLTVRSPERKFVLPDATAAAASA